MESYLLVLRVRSQVERPSAQVRMISLRKEKKGGVFYLKAPTALNIDLFPATSLRLSRASINSKGELPMQDHGKRL